MAMSKGHDAAKGKLSTRNHRTIYRDMTNADDH
jgi:hypothetical protein